MRPVRAVISAWTLVLATALLVSVVAAPATAQASARASVRAPSAKLLVDARAAAKLGFPVVVTKARSTSKTGTTFCPRSTYVAYADRDRKTGMTFTVFACTSAASGARVLSGLGKDATTLPGVSLPPSLGTGAFLLAQPPGYNVWFQQGRNLVQVAFTGDLTQKDTTTPLTAAQAKVLVAAAARQARLLQGAN